jgi:tagatose-6-phosphate ketose/aldose isomerase
LSGDLDFIVDESARQGGEATAREIFQQPAVWREVESIVTSRRDDIEAFLRPLLADPDLRVVLTGAGTSAFAGEIQAPALSTNGTSRGCRRHNGDRLQPGRMFCR